MAHNHSVEVLSAVSRPKKAVMCLMSKYMLDKLRSGVSYRAVGSKFNVNESKYLLRCLNRNTYKTRLCVDQLTKML